MIGTALDEDTARELMLQALKFSRYPMPKMIPVIDLVPNAVWAREVCAGKAECIETSLGYYGTDDPADKNVVHVRMGTPRPVAGIAVHELVHWLQMYYGWGFHDECHDIAAHEVEAYAVEYLRDQWAGVGRPLDIPDVYYNCVARKDHEQLSPDANHEGTGPGRARPQDEGRQGRPGQEQGRQESGEAR